MTLIYTAFLKKSQVAALSACLCQTYSTSTPRHLRGAWRGLAQCVQGPDYYKYMYSNILTNLDYGAEDVRNLARVQIDRALSTRHS